jgi:hypothetical protein
MSCCYALCAPFVGRRCWRGGRRWRRRACAPLLLASSCWVLDVAMNAAMSAMMPPVEARRPLGSDSCARPSLMKRTRGCRHASHPPPEPTRDGCCSCDCCRCWQTRRRRRSGRRRRSPRRASRRMARAAAPQPLRRRRRRRVRCAGRRRGPWPRDASPSGDTAAAVADGSPAWSWAGASQPVA